MTKQENVWTTGRLRRRWSCMAKYHWAWEPRAHNLFEIFF